MKARIRRDEHENSPRAYLAHLGAHRLLDRVARRRLAHKPATWRTSAVTWRLRVGYASVTWRLRGGYVAVTSWRERTLCTAPRASPRRAPSPPPSPQRPPRAHQPHRRAARMPRQRGRCRRACRAPPRLTFRDLDARLPPPPPRALRRSRQVSLSLLSCARLVPYAAPPPGANHSYVKRGAHVMAHVARM